MAMVVGEMEGSGLRLVSWNVNGIRARGKRLQSMLQRLGAEIICLQETRVTRELLDEPTAIVDGFNSYFSYSRHRRGYSGVATFCTDNAVPFAAEEGLSGILANPASNALEGFSDKELKELDSEGRALITKHRVRTCEEKEIMLTVINVYCPRADPEMEDRHHYKLRFYQLLEARAQALLQDGGNVIVLGDLNTAHRPIDHCQPGDLNQFSEYPDRVWMDKFLSCASDQSQLDEINQNSDSKPGLGMREKSGYGLFVDTFRFFHPTEKEAYTCWRTSTGARKTNYGTRIDYIFVNKSLAETELENCILMPEIEGSDHCPVKVFLKSHCVPATKCPPLCTKYMPEFAGQQQKLSKFLVNIQENQSRLDFQNYAETNQNSKLNPQTKKAKLDQRQTGKGLMRKKGKNGRSNSHLSRNLLQFFKPADTNPASKLKTCDDVGLFNKTALTVTGQQQADSKEIKQDIQIENTQSSSQAVFWKSLLKGQPPPPNCSGHREPCLLRVVRKPGPNQGRQFYICPRPEGSVSNPESRCNFFRWVNTRN
ncbi:DNA-(apurinic or apyrimidinic site) lyase 2 isoform X1 [Chiloscyllium plagiosum]|uniref:DNA-(apurinic or apyrimidinic site) lyase 2 isoform X1 n=1 Tax=Chiloscyllium plagiosum TaxID=36176 RepID=UPI001CB881B6|nr:DNA-(apurinic or apyrimidinic site) lyase 2 isoform X1 [Chiloscyllium plagiosum]